MTKTQEGCKYNNAQIRSGYESCMRIVTNKYPRWGFEKKAATAAALAGRKYGLTAANINAAYADPDSLKGTYLEGHFD